MTLALAAVGLPAAAVRAQSYPQAITPAAGSLHSWFGAAMAATSDTLAVGDPEYLAPSGTCPPGRGAVDIYRKMSGTWVYSQRFASTSVIQEDKLGGSVALSGDILVASAEREDVSSTVFRVGAIHVYRRASSAAQFQETARLFPPNPTSNSDFTSLSGVATNGTYVAGATLNTVHVYRIAADGTATLAVSVPAPHPAMTSVALTASNALLMGSDGDAAPTIYQLTQSGATTTATPISADVLTGFGTMQGGLTADNNTVAVSGKTSAGGRFFQFFTVTGGNVQSLNTVSLPHGFDNLSFGGTYRGAKHMSLREGAGLVVGQGASAGLAIAFKYASGVYRYAGMVSLDATPYGITDPGFGKAVAFNGTDMLVSDPNVVIKSGAGMLCVSPSGGGRIHVLVPRATEIPSQLDSYLFAQDFSNGSVVATDGAYLATGSPYGYQVPGSYGQVTLYQNVSGSWVQVENFVPPEVGSTGFGTAVDMSGGFMAISAPSVVDPSTGALRGVVYLKQPGNAGWSGLIQPPASVSGTVLFGQSLAMDGSVLVVGAPRANGIGAAYVYEWNGRFWNGPTATLAPSSHGTPSEQFGAAVAVRGNYLVVSAPYRDLGRGSATGAVQFYGRNSTGAWVAAGEASLPAGIPGGNALGIRVTIGTNYAAATVLGRSVVVYQRAGTATTFTQDSIISGGSEVAFGSSLTIQDPILLVGSVGNNVVHRYSRSGAAFVQTGLLSGTYGSSIGSALDSAVVGSTSFAVIGDSSFPLPGGNGVSSYRAFTQVQ
ncbi:MAG TPA: hypothetical protein VHM31_20560 [Polyangia bacterium]|nr:hypothetical protein [Polyangia bacterium]